MTHVVFRVWLLWGALTFLLLWLFGFNQWARLWELVEVSSPQVEAFLEGLLNIGWQQLPAIILAFVYRRGIFFLFRRAGILVVKKVVMLVAFVLLERYWRHAVATAMMLPGYYTVKSFQTINSWRELHDVLLLRRWFLYLYTATVLTGVTFLGAEFVLALIRGTLALPPIVVRYQAELITFAATFVAASVAQWFLLYVWKRFYVSFPAWVHNFVNRNRRPVFRRLVQMRILRRGLVALVFSWTSLLFMGTFIVCVCLPM